MNNHSLKESSQPVKTRQGRCVQQHYESGGFSGRVLWTVNSFFVFDRELVHNLLPRLGGMDLRVNCGRIVQLWCFKRIFHFLLSLRTEDDKRSITLSTLDDVSWMISCLEGGTKKRLYGTYGHLIPNKEEGVFGLDKQRYKILAPWIHLILSIPGLAWPTLDMVRFFCPFTVTHNALERLI